MATLELSRALPLATALAVAAVSGLYTAVWGAFKDAPYEGFKARSFPRSVLTSVTVMLLVFGIAPLRERVLMLSLFHLFLFTMGMERILNEIYKACFRGLALGGRAPDDDPDRFQIPQRLAFFGRRVGSGGLRALSGLAALALTVWVLLAQTMVHSPAGFLAVAAATGLLIAVLGAYKDAPIEGFQWDKFFRSALLLVVLTPLLHALGPVELGLLVFVEGGLERMLMEFDKSYVQQRVPGKFRSDLQLLDPRFVMRRPWLHRLAMLIVAGMAVLYHR
jgi:hypothetical protein